VWELYHRESKLSAQQIVYAVEQIVMQPANIVYQSYEQVDEGSFFLNQFLPGLRGMKDEYRISTLVMIAI